MFLSIWEGEKHQSVAFHVHTGDQTHNLSMCLDRESNLQLFGVWDEALTNWATRPGLPIFILELVEGEWIRRAGSWRNTLSCIWKLTPELKAPKVWPSSTLILLIDNGLEYLMFWFVLALTQKERMHLLRQRVTYFHFQESRKEWSLYLGQKLTSLWFTLWKMSGEVEILIWTGKQILYVPSY